MDIKDILNSLGLDLSNPEVKRGAVEAIEAILASRSTDIGGGGDMGGAGGAKKEIEVELDPDLIQPSVKHQAAGGDEDIEIEDEENILDQIKHNDPDEPTEKPTEPGEPDPKNKPQDPNKDPGEPPEDPSEPPAEPQNGPQGDPDDDPEDYPSEPKEPGDLPDDPSDPTEPEDPNYPEEPVDPDEYDEPGDPEEPIDPDEPVDPGEPVGGGDGDNLEEPEELEDDDDEDDDFDDDEFDFDDDDLVDDDLKNSTEDDAIKTKQNSRKIKRERTLAAAKKALADAQAKKVSPALIRELEKSIEALEALVEAAAKNMYDISDEEFNQLINRVFDAIQACGDSGLTFKSEEERELQAKEIKADIENAQTQAELSAEDAAKIRAETQAIKAREKETDKYKRKSRDSFKGFQEFLRSLYRAIALQVSNEETRDDTWSAISRRNSGVGVLRQGQKVNDLPNKKIPIIDFYFDQSTSWNANDIKVGMKAVEQLADMEDKGQIKLNVFYFADEVSSTPTRGGTSGWNEIVKNVIATQATNVVVMTDRDMENWWSPQDKPPLSYTVPGYVWYLWKDGDNAPRLPRDLKGRGGVQQYSFSASDV